MESIGTMKNPDSEVWAARASILSPDMFHGVDLRELVSNVGGIPFLTGDAEKINVIGTNGSAPKVDIAALAEDLERVERLLHLRDTITSIPAEAVRKVALANFEFHIGHALKWIQSPGADLISLLDSSPGFVGQALEIIDELEQYKAWARKNRTQKREPLSPSDQNRTTEPGTGLIEDLAGLFDRHFSQEITRRSALVYGKQRNTFVIEIAKGFGFLFSRDVVRKQL
jgi:hypothetical protein